MTVSPEYPRVVRTYDANWVIEVRYTEVAEGVVVRGVFATQEIAEGELIEECPVIPIYPDEDTAPRPNLVRSYTWEWPVYDGGRRMVSKALPLGYLPLYNHSADAPNCKVVGYYDALYAQVVALRRIAAGEELLHDYGWHDTSSARLNMVDRYLRPVRGAKATDAYGGRA